MEVRKTNGSFEEYDEKKLKNIVRKVYRRAKIDYDKDIINAIVDNLYIYDGILCSSIRTQLEEKFKSIDSKLYDAYVSAKKEIDETNDFVEKKKKFIENYKRSSNTANATVDDNSNVGNKNIGVLNAEIHKVDNIKISRSMIMDKLKELYPSFNAKKYVQDIESHVIYKNDESSFAGAISPYCVSITMYPFLTDGIKNIGGLSATPKNIDSFCGMYCNLIFNVSAQYAGAVATSEVLLCFTYFAEKEWGKDFYKHADSIYKVGPRLRELLNKTHYWCDTIKELSEHDFGSEEMNAIRNEIVYNAERPLSKEELDDYIKNIKDNPDYVLKLGDGTRTIKSQIYQYWQQIVYSINQPAGSRGLQSPFTNFSYFDKPFFDGMFGDFYFPDNTKPTWESVKWIQMEFMQWFNAERLKCLMTFPVETVTLLYKDGKFEDEEMFKFVCDEYARGHSFFTYISDTVDSLSSCCFKGNELIQVKKDGLSKTMEIKDFVEEFENESNSFGKKIDTGYQIESYNPETRKFEDTKIIGVLKREYSGNMYLFKTGDFEIIVTPDHILMAKDKRNGAICYLPSKTIYDDYKHYELAVKEEDKISFNGKYRCGELTFDGKIFVYDIELEKNHYFSTDNFVTHNCRLKNKVQIHEFNFTNGNVGIQTGSKSVITINLARNIQNWFNIEKAKNPDYKFTHESYPSLKKHLGKLLERIYKYHTAYNELLWDMYDANLLPVYKAGFINLNKQYLTIGLNGLNQAVEFLGMTCNDNPDYEEFCREIFTFIKESNQAHKVDEGPHKLSFNTELVPAESLAVKNYNWDKEDDYWVPTDTNLYASYIFKPNDPNVSILEKIRMHGTRFIGDQLDGGSAAHLQLDAHLSSEQYKHILIYAAENGCQYLTFNVPNCQCENCGFIAKQPFSICPHCGSKNVSLWDRVIGYITKIKNWSEGRQIEQKTRIYHHIEEGDL